jgi:hypothetical protein
LKKKKKPKLSHPTEDPPSELKEREVGEKVSDCSATPPVISQVVATDAVGA